MPNTKGKPITVSKYFDAKNAHDLDTCRYLYDIIIFINNTPLQSYCKIQVTVEKSTYISEIVSDRIGTDIFMDLRYRIIMIGITTNGTYPIYSIKRSVIND